MSSKGVALSGNPFEEDNAKTLSSAQLVATFVPTVEFERLLSRKNHVILGARGSGKTALAKMLSHEHLSKLADYYEPAREAIESKRFIGVYVPTDLEWVGALGKKEQWPSAREAEEHFRWKLNLSACYAFLTTLRSCFHVYIENKGERARVERDLMKDIAAVWSEGKATYTTIHQLQDYLAKLGYDKEQQVTRARVLGVLPDGEQPLGMTFDSSLFSPVRRGIALASKALEFPEDCAWFLCLDEWELLEAFHHRILNTCMRSNTGNLFFKITTMPYCHYTLETNTDAPLTVGDDFEYVYIDQQPVSDTPKDIGVAYTFADDIFKKRLAWSKREWPNATLVGLLGKSELLDPKEGNWGIDSPIFGLLRKYASQKTIERARRLLKFPKKMSNEMARKIEGALLLREAIATKGKALDVYSGASMLVRCADGNPRRLIRMLKRLTQEAIRVNKTSGSATLEKKVQTRILREYSGVTLSRVQSEREVGPALYRFIKLIGEYVAARFKGEPLATDQVGSVSISQEDFTDEWKLVKRAVGIGLLFPNTMESNADQMPETEGIFHLAYVLAPHFLVLPRRGKQVSFRRIKRTEQDVMRAQDNSQIPLSFMSEEKDEKKH